MTPRELLTKAVEAWGLVAVATVEEGVVGKEFLCYRGNRLDIEWDPEAITKVEAQYSHDAAVVTVMFLLESVANRILEIDYKENLHAEPN